MTPPDALPYSDRYIQDHQLDAQEAVLDAEILRAKLELNEHSAPKAWAFLEELKTLKQGIGVVRRELHDLPVKRKTLWDRVRIRFYIWAVGDRFQ